MTRRLTFEEVKKAVEDQGYELLESEYKNSRTKLKYKCPKHPDEINLATVNVIKKGIGCPHCAGNHKFTIKEVKQKFEERGYELLEKKYINNRTKMKYRCSLHPDKKLEITLDSLLNKGAGCPYCSGHILPHTFDEVKKTFEDRGYELLETKYINSRQKLKYRCPNHPDKLLQITFHAFLRGRGCRFCAIDRDKNRMGEDRHSWKGGITSLTHILRESTKQWKLKVLENYDFKCALTNTYHKDLQVHHTKSFTKIRDEVLNELGLGFKKTRNNYTEKELALIVKKIEQRHDEIMGVPLRKNIHKLFHSLYGQTNNTFEQFCEFKQRWESGEFADFNKSLI